MLGLTPKQIISKTIMGDRQWIWSTAFTIFSVTVILFSHDMLAIYWPFASNCSVCALSISTCQQKSHKGICDI